MKKIALALALMSLFAFACSPSQSSKELYDTAQFEELQNNPGHAIQLYEEIVRKYPESEYAKKAQARLEALSKGKAEKQ